MKFKYPSEHKIDG